jgi:hypothetical protein
LERAAHKALTEFYERHLEDTGTPVSLFPLRDEGNPTWNRCMAAACDTAQQTYHVGWAFVVRYVQHVSSIIWEVTMVGAYQRMCLEECDYHVQAKDNLIDELRKGNRELLQQSHSLERRNKELTDDLLQMYRRLQEKMNSLDSTHTQLHHTNDEVASAQNYVQHLDIKLKERDRQLETSQAQVEELTDVVYQPAGATASGRGARGGP